MGDIRDQLNVRLETLRAQEPGFLHDLGYGHPDHRYVAASRGLVELRQIEGILATFQLSDAQVRLVLAQQEATEAQKAATAEQRKANEADSKARANSEEATFWTRRFINTVSIASAAALVSVLTFATKSDSPFVPAKDLRGMLILFGGAAMVGGIVPIYQLLGIRVREVEEYYETMDESHPDYNTQHIARTLRLLRFIQTGKIFTWALPIMTTALFIGGMMLVTGVVQGYLEAKPKVPEKPKPAEIRVLYVPTPAPVPVAVNSAVKQSPAAN